MAATSTAPAWRGPRPFAAGRRWAWAMGITITLGATSIAPRTPICRPPTAVRAQQAADAAPLTLRPIAHRGGGLRGLAVDGDAVYVGEGPDVIVFRAEAGGQLTEVRRVELPDVVFSLAIAPEADRLYAAANNTVYALSIADRRRPTVIGQAGVPVDGQSQLAASGEVAYARLTDMRNRGARCVVAVRFAESESNGAAGAPACVPGGEPFDSSTDRILVGDGVLALVNIESWSDAAPPIGLFDIADPQRPRFAHAIAVGDSSVVAAMAARRLWVLSDETSDGTHVRSFDVSNLDVEPPLMAHWVEPEGPDHAAVWNGEIWLTALGGLIALDPLATSAPDKPKRRWMTACTAIANPWGSIALGGGHMYTLNEQYLAACVVPPDDRHATDEEATWVWSPVQPERVAATGGRAFTAGVYGTLLSSHIFRSPANLVAETRWSTQAGNIRDIGANDTHVLVALESRLVAVRPSLDTREPAGEWDVPGPSVAGGTFGKHLAVAGGRAVVLRDAALHVVDLTRPDAPAARVPADWRLGRAVASTGNLAYVAAGGRTISGAPQQFAPHVVAYDLAASPPRKLGEVELADRLGWTPVGIAVAGAQVVVALTDAERTSAEVVVLDARDPSRLAVSGRSILSAAGDGDVDVRAVAASEGAAIVIGHHRAAAAPDAPVDAPAPVRRGAVWVIDVGQPDGPVVRERRSVAGWPNDVVMDGRDVIVAAGPGGLQQFRLEAPGEPPPRVWRLVLPWLAPGVREVRGAPRPIRVTGG